jgi:hypothetical protein
MEQAFKDTAALNFRRIVEDERGVPWAEFINNNPFEDDKTTKLNLAGIEEKINGFARDRELSGDFALNTILQLRTGLTALYHARYCD